MQMAPQTMLILLTGKKEHMKKLKEKFPENEVIMIADFSKNCSASLPEEAKAAHFATTQITLYPVMVYRRTADGVIQDGFYVISDDLRHDYHAVHSFQKVILNTLAQERVIVSRLHEFTDGCTGQVKSHSMTLVTTTLTMALTYIVTCLNHIKEREILTPWGLFQRS